MAWCEDNRVDYLFGLARNERLTAEITTEIEAARIEAEASGKPARRFSDFTLRIPEEVARESAMMSPTIPI